MSDRRDDPDKESARMSEAMLAIMPVLAVEADPGAALARFAEVLINRSSHLRGACVWIDANSAVKSRPDHIVAKSSEWSDYLNDEKGPPGNFRAARSATDDGEDDGEVVAEQIVGPRRKRSLRPRRCSTVAVPVELGADVRALLLLYADRHDYFNACVRRTIAAGCAAIALVLSNEGEDERVRKRDALTALPNQLFFYECLDMLLAQAVRKRQCIGLALLDLEDLRDINEHFGRREGDRLLCEMALRLKRALNKGQILARIGGNEFAILEPSVMQESEFEDFLKTCLETAKEDYKIGDRTVNPQLRIGASVCSLPPPSADTVMRDAGHALDRAKQAGGSQLRLLQAGEHESGETRYEITESIRQALRDEHFTLHYQPQLDVLGDSPTVTGAEALIRMRGGSQGLRPPGEFIPVAERSSLIRDIGVWVINEALAQAVKWRRGGVDLSIGVNVGAGHLLHDDFIRELRAALERHPGFPPAALEIELTETAALADLERARRVLAECRDIGLGVAVDDFGTGHASLSYVQSLPVTRIKIDQRFVRDLPTEPRNMAVITGAIASSRLLGIEVIAEGVETTLHGSTLIRLGCGQLQGYALTAPLDEAAFRAWLRRWQAPSSWQAWAGDRATAQILPLLFAEISHRRQASRLLGQALAPPTEGVAECALTQWLTEEQQRTPEQLPVLRQLQQVHVEFHRAAGMLKSARSSASEGRLQSEREEFTDKTKALMAHLVRLQEQLCPRQSR